MWVAVTIGQIATPRGASLDESIFLDVGRSLVSVGLPIQHVATTVPVMFFDHTPGMAWLSALATLTPDPLVAIRLASWLSILGAALLVPAMVRGLPGIAGGIFVATSPLLVAFGWEGRMEAPMALAMAASAVLVLRGRLGWAGVAAGVAVLFKEFALLFTAVIAVGILARSGWRPTVRFALPSAVVFGGFLAYAALVDLEQLGGTIMRWVFNASGEGEAFRFEGTGVDWLLHVGSLLGWPLVAFLTVSLVRRPPALLVGYVVAAVGVSLVLSTKEPRWLMGVVPVMALAAGLARWPLVLGRPRHRSDADLGVDAGRVARDITATEQQVQHAT
jgi:hypothetical protein